MRFVPNRPGPNRVRGFTQPLYGTPTVFSDSPGSSSYGNATYGAASYGASAQIALSGTLTGVYSHSVAVSGTVVISGTATDSYSGGVTYHDSPSGTITLSGTRTAVHVYTDAPGSGAGATYGSGTYGSGAYGSAATAAVVISGSLVAVHRYTAAPSGTVSVGGTLAATYLRSDSASGTISLSGTVTASHRYTESQGGTVSESGTLSAVHIYSEVRGGLIRLNGHVPFKDAPAGRVACQGSVGDNYTVAAVVATPILFSGQIADQQAGQSVRSGVGGRRGGAVGHAGRGNPGRSRNARSGSVPRSTGQRVRPS